ncbi:hypothetical protein [Acetobacter oeni]|uniref:HigA2-like helix-turn-helix domain-containing protein n=1 Tax=Acetobacter oeni TaxID=304077 RepID=A0A511XKX0_9PROT|nr:hypothetical protein [Acetobacter oeni]MBB3883828.1 hypothetical protein [Acetobacter oeni]NHO19831.1 hypothetical protein [Acetobacter oeni]GBR10519.1 hypothetical protein AA21952_3100 [Acetobacter oeni LMG 21952]GEN63580.1 hypothetical protein AOE01nite_18040 [Acetobacter oeni]
MTHTVSKIPGVVEHPRLDRVDAFRILRDAIGKYGTQRKFALAHGLREQDVSDVLCSRRPVPDSMLRAVGLRRVEYFVAAETGSVQGGAAR